MVAEMNWSLRSSDVARQSLAKISESGLMCAAALVLAPADVWRIGKAANVADEAIGCCCCGAECGRTAQVTKD